MSGVSENPGYQIRHEHWGVFQGERSENKRAPAGSWTVVCPGTGLCKFETRERAQGYIDLICRFFQGQAKSCPPESFTIEPFNAALAEQLGGQTEVSYLKEICFITDGQETPDELKARIAELETRRDLKPASSFTPCVHCNEFHAGTIKEAKGHLHESREGVGYVRLMVIGRRAEFCWRCGCDKSGWSNRPNVVRAECPSPRCPCHTEEKCQ